MCSCATSVPTPVPAPPSVAPSARQREELEALGYAASFEPSVHASGARTLAPGRVSPGLNLWDSGHDSVAFLTDDQGHEVHRWSSSLAAVLPDTIVGRRDDHHQHHFSRVDVTPAGGLVAIWQTYGLVKLDRDSRVLWAIPGGFHHHLEIEPDGSLWVISDERRTTDAFGPAMSVWRDQVEHRGADGHLIERVDLLSALQAAPEHLAHVFPTPPHPPDIFHANSVRVVADGAIPGLPKGPNLLVSLRNPSALVVVNVPTARVVWSERGPWLQQHDAAALGDGRIQLFDNVGGPAGTARVVVWDSVADRLIWSWPSGDAPPIRARMLGAVQALPNGGTLVTHAIVGDVYEVAPDGDVVWEFTNPNQITRTDAEADAKPETAVILAMRRIPPGWFGDWLKSP